MAKRVGAHLVSSMRQPWVSFLHPKGETSTPVSDLSPPLRTTGLVPNKQTYKNKNLTDFHKEIL